MVILFNEGKISNQSDLTLFEHVQVQDIGLITDGDDREYRGLTEDFVDWCPENYLRINPRKTKELIVDC